MLVCQQVRTDVTAPTPLSSSALAAFVRGIERRALVVAEFQTGEVLVAERAVAVAMRAFVPAAVDQPMAGWSTHFWRLLATTPQLRDTAADGLWPQDLAHLSQLADADRMALLLRIGAGLDEQQAAEVLGVPVDAYCQSLALACPRDAAGQPDPQAWRALAEAVQARVRDLSPERQAQLSRLRDSLVVELPVTPARADAEPVMQAERRPQRAAARQRPASGAGQWLWLLTGAALLAGVAWAWMASGDAPEPAAADQAPAGLDADNPVQQENLQQLELPPPAPPAAPEPLLEPGQAALPKQADFLAWLAAGAPLPVDESQPLPRAQAPLAVAVLSRH